MPLARNGDQREHAALPPWFCYTVSHIISYINIEHHIWSLGGRCAYVRCIRYQDAVHLERVTHLHYRIAEFERNEVNQKNNVIALRLGQLSYRVIDPAQHVTKLLLLISTSNVSR